MVATIGTAIAVSPIFFAREGEPLRPHRAS